MESFTEWHKNYAEKMRTKMQLSHYQVYWLSWLKGIIMGLLIK